MMTRFELVRQIQAKKSVLCVGLDPDLAKIPQHLLLEDDPIFAFNKAIIDATHEFAVAYKPNIAFYESLGVSGWSSLRKTLDYIPKECFTIADAKRGDIGNTSAMYARTFFFTYEFDSVTINPYMGSDSVMPFLGFDGKWAIVLGLTSNPGAEDFQYFNSGEMHLYERVLDKLKGWGSEENIMVVVGATRAADLARIRARMPKHFFLVPGVGAQGGNLEEVMNMGWIEGEGGLLINASRSILYAGKGKDFALAAREEARNVQEAMEAWMRAQ
jgi:orotidine-5'-phosphate decarboxylase